MSNTRKAQYAGVGTPLFALLVLATCSRGMLELAFEKASAAAIQAALVFACFATWAFRARRESCATKKRTSRFAMFFGSMAVGSACISVSTAGAKAAFATAASMLLLTFCLSVGGGSKAAVGNARAASAALAIVGVLMVVTGIFQTLGLESALSGETVSEEIFRPPSITGSYLHYPLCLAIISLQVLQTAVLYRTMWRWACSLGFFVALLAAYGRSGYVILGLTMVFSAIFEAGSRHQRHTRRSRRRTAVLISGALVCICFMTQPQIRQRAWSIFDLQEGANSDRIDTWLIGASMVVRCGPVISSCTGVIGNTGAAFSGREPAVVESGILQQIVNFGAPATIAFYALLLGLCWACRPSHTILRGLIVACVVESFVYQSIEVIPFIVLLSVTPILSRGLPERALAQSRVSTAGRLSALLNFSASGRLPNRSVAKDCL